MQERWTTAGDERVCPTCRALEGQIFESGQGPMPPIHPGCRCSRLPVGQPVTAGQGPFAQQPIQPLTGPGGAPPQPIQGITPRRAIPQPAPQPTTIEQYGRGTLVQPPLPEGGIPVFAGGRQVGAFATGIEGEYVPFQAPSTMGPVRASEQQVPELREVREQAKRVATELSGWQKQVNEVREAGKKVLESVKEWARPGGPGGAPTTARGAFQQRLLQEHIAGRFPGDPYSQAWQEMRELQMVGREAGGVVTPTRRPGLPGMISRAISPLQQQIASIQEQAPSGLGGLRAAVYGMYAAKRGWQMTGGQLINWAQQYGAYDLAQQQAAFAMGQPVEAFGPYQEMATAQSRWANLRASLGQSAWQNFGFLAGAGGMGTVQPTALTSAATLGLGAIAPWGMAKLGAGALSLAGAKTGAGLLAGAAPLLAQAGAGLGGVAAGGAISDVLGPMLWGEQYTPTGGGLGGTLGRLWDIGKQTAFLGGRGLAGGLRGLGLGPETEEEWARNQEWVYRMMFPEHREKSPLEMLSEQQRAQLTTQLATTTGGQAPTSLMETITRQAPLMGFEDPTKFAAQLQTLALRAGYMPGGAGMGGALTELAGAGRTGLLQVERAAGTIAQMQEMFGGVPGGSVLGFAGQWAEMAGPERRRMGMMLSGNRQLWSDWGRQTGQQELITMEAGGLPIYTQELRGLQAEAQTVQRGYRDWQQQQQWEQMQATQQYTRATWDIQDQLRAQQQAQATWQFGYQQRAFTQGEQQWQQQYALQGQQAMESMALGRQIFEARVGWQAEDVATQEQRAATQYQWQMADWAYGENVSQLQYGWRMEDISESIRFATGREKKDLMEEQERMVILESMRREQSEEDRSRMEEERQWEEEDFERSKSENEELIALQREQYDMELRHYEEDREMALRHHEEDLVLQVERMEKGREFYEESERLEDDRIKLGREHQEQQMAWAIEAWEKAKEHNEQVDRLQDQTRELQEQQQDVIANFQRMLVYSEELQGSFEAWQQSRGYEWGSTSSDWDVPTSESTYYTGQHAPGTGPLEYQHGGPVGSTEPARLHQGEYVVPVAGSLVVRDENKSLTEYEKKALAIFEEIKQWLSRDRTVIVESMNPQKAASEHIPTLTDAFYSMM